MKRTTSTIVLALLVATGAAGCGSENPAGPSFARSTPVAETSRETMTLTPEPGSSEEGTWTQESDIDAVDQTTGRNGRGYRKPNPGNAYGHN